VNSDQPRCGTPDQAAPRHCGRYERTRTTGCENKFLVARAKINYNEMCTAFLFVAFYLCVGFMADVPRLRLQELAPFQALGGIAKEFNVNFTLFGGTASRVAMHMAYLPGQELDLFDLTPFSSDIDLWHSGSKDKTPDIKQAIRQQIPFASWCRWSIIDGEAGQRAAQNRALSTYVPLRSIVYRTDGTMRLSMDALADIEARRVSFSRNPNYTKSEFAREGRDVEIFGLLLALNALADMREIAGEGKLDTHHHYALHWLQSEDTVRQMQFVAGTPHLKTRLWQLLATNIARTVDTDISELLLGVVSVAQRSDAISGLDSRDIEFLIRQGSPLSVSKPAASGGFRVPELSPVVLTGESAEVAFERKLAELGFGDLPEDERPRIDPAFEIVGFVPEITVRAESSANSDERQDTVYFSDADDEFLHLAWVPDPNTQVALSPKGLTVSVIPWQRSAIHESRVGLAVGGVFRSGRGWLRVDLGDVVTRGATAKDGSASLLILQARDAEKI